MPVWMFDCGFGDAFRLDEYTERPLYIDFGNKYFEESKSLKQEDLYHNVLNNINMTDSKDFLLTHFHTDHFSGLMYWNGSNDCRLNYPKIKFKNIYIPGIWEKNIIALLLLAELPTTHAQHVTMLEFLEIFCASGWNGLSLVNKGTNIGGNGLVALWPDKTCLEEHAERLIQKLEQDGEFAGIKEDLFEQANSCVEVLNRIIAQHNDNYAEELESIKKVKESVLAIGERLGEEKINLIRARYKLNAFGNKCSIVFHNGENTQNKNILFAGDVTSNVWRIMQGETSAPLKLHETYRVIKVPHHGTRRHRAKLSGYLNENSSLLIPNGHICRNGYKIWATYVQYINDKSAMAICAGNDSCNAYKNGCICEKRVIVNEGTSRCEPIVL